MENLLAFKFCLQIYSSQTVGLFPSIFFGFLSTHQLPDSYKSNRQQSKAAGKQG